MAKIVDRSLELGKTLTKYPWEKWLDGHCWELVEGKDYPAGINFAPAVYGAARHRGVKVAVRRIEGGLLLQAQRKEDGDGAP